MNANKLADEVEMWGNDLLALNMKGGIPVIKAATMLRQQQAKLETAEQKVLDAFERGKMFGYAQGLKKAQKK